MTEHTSEPWQFQKDGEIEDHKLIGPQPYFVIIGGDVERTIIAYTRGAGFSLSSGKANASRIVAAVNACKGISTEQLEALVEKDSHLIRIAVNAVTRQYTPEEIAAQNLDVDLWLAEEARRDKLDEANKRLRDELGRLRISKDA